MMRQNTAKRPAAVLRNLVSGIAALAAAGTAMLPAPAARGAEQAAFPDLPPPPQVAGLTGFDGLLPEGRQRYLRLIRQLASERGLPAEVADAVVAIESAYQPDAVGGVGEVGLMQVLPSTAEMLGYRGTPLGLFEPETNMRYGIAYLAQAWRLTAGDLCRTLMKYRAGHGEEVMTARSVEYCRRARAHLARLGSPLARQAGPAFATASAVDLAAPTAALAAQGNMTQGQPLRVRQRRTIPSLARHARTADDSRRFWIAHERRIKAIKAKLARRSFASASR